MWMSEEGVGRRKSLAWAGERASSCFSGGRGGEGREQFRRTASGQRGRSLAEFGRPVRFKVGGSPAAAERTAPSCPDHQTDVPVRPCPSPSRSSLKPGIWKLAREHVSQGSWFLGVVPPRSKISTEAERTLFSPGPTPLHWSPLGERGAVVLLPMPSAPSSPLHSSSGGLFAPPSFPRLVPGRGPRLF